MEYSTQLVVPKIENPFDVDWLFHEKQSENLSSWALDFSPFDQYQTFIEANYSSLVPFSYQNDQLPRIDFKSFEDFDSGFSLENAFSHFEEPIKSFEDFDGGFSLENAFSHFEEPLKSFEDFDGGFSLENALSHFEEPNMVDEKPQTDNMVLASFSHHSNYPVHENMKSSPYEDENVGYEVSRLMIDREMFGIHENIKNSPYEDKNVGYEVSRLMIDREVFGSLVKKNHDEEEVIMSCRGNSNNKSKKKKVVELELDVIQKYFNVPIKEAAMELGIGVTRLKKRCRELNIMRWPHRKLKSLKYLLKNVKKMGLSSNEIMMLEEQQRLVEEAPDMELTERAKKLRQACFKANYKSKRSLAAAAHRS
ncbi:protein RKD4 [Humulus lupulus]|uniref:protein RKD4 n=1 Tax=Humulus lupulus TaxID=3486 RepID=UPI002B414506|nr:protein RKD4 [Humulus lupulus]